MFTSMTYRQRFIFSLSCFNEGDFGYLFSLLLKIDFFFCSSIIDFGEIVRLNVTLSSMLQVVENLELISLDNWSFFSFCPKWLIFFSTDTSSVFNRT